MKLMMQTEVEEVYEPFHEGRGSSSTMPQKRNPISSVYITATASLVRQHVAALLDAMVEDHERATGPWEIEWIAVPEIFSLAAGALAQTRFMVSGLQVDEKKMRANLDITRGLIVSEAVMMGLGPHIGRQYAHDLVYDICRQVIATGRPLVDLLAENSRLPSTSTAPRWRSSATRRTISAKPAKWWTGCWRCGVGGTTATEAIRQRRRATTLRSRPLRSCSSGLAEKRRQLRHGVVRRRCLHGGGDVFVKARDAREHIAGRRIVAEVAPDFFHLGHPAVGFRGHPRHLPHQPGEQMRLAGLDLLMQRRGQAGARGAEHRCDRDRGQSLGDAAIGHFERRRGADRPVERRERNPERAQARHFGRGGARHVNPRRVPFGGGGGPMMPPST